MVSPVRCALTVIISLALTSCRQAPATPATPSVRATVVGLVKAGPGNPVVFGRVRLLDVRGTAIAGASGTVWSRGQFALHVEASLLPGDYQVVVEGGSHSGGVAVDQMRADVRIAEKEHGPVYVTPLSTVAAEWMSRHAGASLAASRIAAKRALGIPEWAHHVNAAIWTEKYVSSSALQAAVAKAGGFAPWARDVVDAYERGGMTPYPPAPATAARGEARAASVGAMAAGGFAATVAWTVVANQAASCDPSSSNIPGIGWLGAMLNSSGMIRASKACTDNVSAQLALIEEQLDQIGSQVSTLGDMIDEVLKLQNEGNFLQGVTELSPYRNAVMTRHADETALELNLASVLEECPVTTPAGETRAATIWDLAGTVDGNGNPTKTDYICSKGDSKGEKASEHWTTVQEAAGSNMNSQDADSNWDDAITGLQAGIQGSFGLVKASLPYLYWQWVANQPAVPLVTRDQIERYVEFVDALGSLVVARALQEISHLRQASYASGIYDYDPATKTDTSLASSIANDLKSKFSFYAGGATLDALIPAAQLPASLGYQDPNSWDLSTQPPVGPILDIKNRNLWISACFDSPGPPYLPPPPGQTLDTGSPRDCPTRGIVAWIPDRLTQNDSHWWLKPAPGTYNGAEFPSYQGFPGWDSTRWARDPSGATAVASVNYQRPTPSEVLTLVAIARDNGQAGPAIASWLERNGGGVLDGVTSNPVATGTLMIHCDPSGDGWNCGSNGVKDSDTAFINFLSLFQILPDWTAYGWWGGASNYDIYQWCAWPTGGASAVTYYQWQVITGLPMALPRQEYWNSHLAASSNAVPQDACGQGTVDASGMLNPYDLNQLRSVALLVGAVTDTDMGNYVPFYGQ